ncbi:hypothetical protein QTP70_029848, partial [Hemibagrus guttatus]
MSSSRDMLHRFVIVYIDDILIYSPNLSDHVDHVKQVLHRLAITTFTSSLRNVSSTFLKLKKWTLSQEVDASALGVGAVLSQRRGETPVLHPCAYFSKKFSRTMILGTELLAIKLALEEWRHWLEGANPPFQVITDHKNLQYIREAKRLNPRQTRWVLFFTRFNFCVTYCLSRIHSPDPMPEEPEPILPPDLFVCPITWSLDDNIRAATEEEPAPPGGPDEGKLVPLPIPRRPWSQLGIDFAVDLPVSNGFTTILIAVDRFSKTRVSPTNGQTECKIQEIGSYLRAYCHDHQHDWSQYLPWAEYAQNSLRQESTKLTPFQCILGYQPPLFPWSAEPSEVPTVDHWFRESERVWGSAHVHLQRAVRRQKVQADVRCRDAPLYHTDDKVWLSTRDICLRLPCKKLSPRYTGPFTILRQINDVTYELQLPRQYHISPTFHISFLKPFTDSVFPPPSVEPEVPLPPKIDTEDTIYQVREVVNSRRRGSCLQYLVNWEGLSGLLL